MKHILFIISICISIASCSKLEDLQENKLDASKKQTLLEIKYGSKTRHTLNIALPANRDENTPVVIYIHGGAWLFGDKNVHDTEMNLLAKNGIACATINYRFASDITDVRYEEMLSDVKLAIDFLSSKAATYHIADSRFGIVGQSAGAHLSICAAYTQNTDNKIKAVVSWAGPVNLLDPEQLKITGGKMVAKNLVGCSLKTAADTLLYKNASPFYQIHSTMPPTLIIHGTKDIAVPYSSVVAFYSQLKNYGEQHQLITLEGKGHLWSGETMDNARSRTIDWFKQNL